MAHLAELYIKAETLQKVLDTLNAKKEKNGVSLTISVNDEVNQYGQNVSSYVSQSKEDRENKKPKFYVGNGKVFWSDGNSPLVPKKETSHTPKKEYQEAPADNDLPF